MKGLIICLILVHPVSSEASKLSENEETKTEDNFQATLKNEDGDGFCKALGFRGHALFYKRISNSQRILERVLLLRKSFY